MRLTQILWLLAGVALAGCTTQNASVAVREAELRRPTKVLSVRDFGAVGDGLTKDTDAIARAIDAGAKAGGAVIQFPAGTYYTGPIQLRSNITLELTAGATLRFSTDRADYPLVLTRWEGTECMNFSPLIRAENCRNIAITGHGTIDGNGPDWWAWGRLHGGKALGELRRQGASGTPVAERIFGEKLPGLRPALIEPWACQNVLIEGVTITQSPFWTVHPVYCQNVTMRYLTIAGTGPNTDGIDVDSCRQVLIERSTFQTADDCVAIKSGRDEDGRRVNRPSEDVVVRYCTMNAGNAGVAVGSETSGGVRRVLVSDCTFSGTLFGVRLKTRRGRGNVVENVTYTNLLIEQTPQEAISINMQYESPPVESKSERTPVFRNIVVSNTTAKDCAKAATIMGLSESPIENLLLKNLKLDAREGVDITHVDGLTISNVKVNGQKGTETLRECRRVTVDGVARDSAAAK